MPFLLISQEADVQQDQSSERDKFIHRQDEIMITYVEEFNVPL